MSGTQELLEFVYSIDPNFDASSVNSINTAIHALDDLFDQSPKQTASKVDILLAFVQRTANGTLICEDQDRYQLLDLVLGIMKKYPKLLKKQKCRISQLYRLIMDLVVVTVSEPTHQWMNPPNGFKEDLGRQGSQSVIISSICSCCDQLSQLIDFEDVIQYLQPLYLEYIQKQDNWRYTFSALMTASQIGVRGADVEKIDLFVRWAFVAAEYQHPKVRYAAMHLLGQLSEDLNPQFGQKYYDFFVPLSLKLTQDSVPRVVAHTYACITNYFDECEQPWKIQQLIEKYLPSLVHSLSNSQSWVMENSLSALNSFAIADNVFEAHLSDLIVLTYDIIAKHSGQEQFKQTVGQCIELLGSLITHQRRQVVEHYLSDYVKVLFTKREDIEITYFMQGWQKICLAYQNFTDITYLYPILLESCKKMLDDYSDSDCINGFLSLEETFVAFKTQAAPFVDDTMSLAKATFENNGYITGLREAGFKLMMIVMKETRPIGGHELNQWQNTVRNIFTYIFRNIEEELDDQEDLEDISILFKGVEDLTAAFGTSFSSSELVALTDRLLCYSRKIEQTYSNVESNKITFETDGQLDSESEVELTDDRIDDLEDSLEIIPDILEKILKAATQTNTKLAIVEKMQAQIEASVSRGELMELFGIQLALGILQALEYAEISPLWSRFTELFVHFSSNKVPSIRNAAVYGLNLIVKKGPSGLFDQKQIQSILQLLSNAFTLPFQNPEGQPFISLCKDNIIAVLGVLIKGYTAQYPDVLNQTVRANWLSQLPLNKDIEQGNAQQELLLDILAHNPSLLIKEAQDLVRVCQIHANFVAKRNQKDHKEYIQKTRQSLLMMKQWSLFKESADYLWSHLTTSQRHALSHLMK